MMLSRRALLIGLPVATAALAACRRERPVSVSRVTGSLPPAPGATTVGIVRFSDAGERLDTAEVAKVAKTEAEWREQLSDLQFQVTREAGTERPFTGALLNEHRTGVFRCICCDTALFSSATKFDSGTGWPSFWAPIAPENVTEATDESFGMTRTAVSCALCDAHLGHAFNDGPPPTGLRYCMNAAAMRFAAGA